MRRPRSTRRSGSRSCLRKAPEEVDRACRATFSMDKVVAVFLVVALGCLVGLWATGRLSDSASSDPAAHAAVPPWTRACFDRWASPRSTVAAYLGLSTRRSRRGAPTTPAARDRRTGRALRTMGRSCRATPRGCDRSRSRLRPQLDAQSRDGELESLGRTRRVGPPMRRSPLPPLSPLSPSTGDHPRCSRRGGRPLPVSLIAGMPRRRHLAAISNRRNTKSTISVWPSASLGSRHPTRRGHRGCGAREPGSRGTSRCT